MKKYYIIKNNEKEGPFSISDLKSKKINIDTLVWHKKLDDWVKAKEIKETAEKYRKGEYIDIKAISKLRSQQDDSKRKKKTSKR